MTADLTQNVNVPGFGTVPIAPGKFSPSELSSAIIALAALAEELGATEEVEQALTLLGCCDSSAEALELLQAAEYSTEQAILDAGLKRYAFVLARADTAEDTARQVAAYLPGNYKVTGVGPDPEDPRFRRVHLCGRDRMGWTLDGYVRPRLASGPYGCTEVNAEGEAL